jgi:hypothetical protein
VSPGAGAAPPGTLVELLPRLNAPPEEAVGFDPPEHAVATTLKTKTAAIQLRLSRPTFRTPHG